MKKIVIEIEQFQLTVVITLICFMMMLGVVAGFFWGKKSALEEFSEQIKSESFADKVYAALYAMKDKEEERHIKEPSKDCSVQEGMQAPDDVEEKEKKLFGEKLFCANLISYQSKDLAEGYVRALKARGIGSSVSERMGITARGKKKSWFQVISDPATYEETEHMVKRLSVEDRLAGVSIVETAVNELNELVEKSE